MAGETKKRRLIDYKVEILETNMLKVTRKKWTGLCISAPAMLVAVLFAGTSSAQQVAGEIPASPDTLRICASANENPYTSKDGSGFENKVAQIIAKAMDRKAVFVYTEKPAIYLVRDFLDKNQCDVVMGLDTGDERVLTSKPYYRTGYVFVTRTDRNIHIKDWEDGQLEKLVSIAISVGSPAELILKAIGKYETNMNYMYSLINFKSPRNQYVRLDPSRMVNEVIQGKADAAIAYGAEVGRYVKASSVPLTMEFVPEDRVADGQGKTIEFNYSQSMAVRKSDGEILKQIDAAIAKEQSQITKVLEDEGIPLLPIKS
jgi:mxaJ protein